MFLPKFTCRGKRKRVGKFVTVGVIVRMDNRHEVMVKENYNGGWSSDDMVLWLWRRQNRDVVEWWGEWSMLR
jgi:hypothetical protein